MFSKPVIAVLWIFSLIIAACVPLYIGSSRSHEDKANPVRFASKNETNACLEEVVGEKGAASAVIVKALIQLRNNQEEQAYIQLETLLDLNVIFVGQNAPQYSRSTNMLKIIREYRSQHSQFSDALRNNGNAVLKDRNEKAQRLLSL